MCPPNSKDSLLFFDTLTCRRLTALLNFRCSAAPFAEKIQRSATALHYQGGAYDNYYKGKEDNQKEHCTRLSMMVSARKPVAVEAIVNHEPRVERPDRDMG